MRMIVLALTMMAAPAVAAEQQFDLVCRSDDGKTQERYRLDLDAGEWCAGDCERVMKVQETTSGLITLHREEQEFPYVYRAYNEIDRNTGSWSWYNYDSRYTSIQDVKGLCAKADFSGILAPTRKF